MKTTAKAIGVDVKIAFAAVFLASRFFPSAFLADALVCLTLLMAALCLRRVTAVNLFVSGALVAIGMAMLARSGAGLERWREGVLENAGIVALVMSTPPFWRYACASTILRRISAPLPHGMCETASASTSCSSLSPLSSPCC